MNRPTLQFASQLCLLLFCCACSDTALRPTAVVRDSAGVRCDFLAKIARGVRRMRTTLNRGELNAGPGGGGA